MSIRPLLRRFEAYVFGPVSESNPVIIPVSGASFVFYRQGATAAEELTIGPHETIDLQVYHCGAFKDDAFELAGCPDPETNVGAFTVAPTPSYLLSVKHASSGYLTVCEVGDRFWNVDQILEAYLDPRGGSTVDVVSDVNGRAACYIDALRFDYTVTLPSGEVRQFVDAQGSYVMRS